jgi:hypothetical protein
MARSPVLAVAILGAWIMSTLCMWFAATKSFATVDRVMQSPAPQLAEITKPLGEPSTRMVLRHMASEINRSLFWGYGILQIAFGAILFFLTRRQSPRHSLDVGLVAAMLVLALIVTVVLTPLITSVGRSLDFLPRNPPPPVMPRFWMLHGAFTSLDGIKLLTGTGLLTRWILAKVEGHGPGS